MHDLADLVHRINTQDAKMQSYVSNYHDLERFTLEGFAHWIIAQDTTSVQGLLDRIHLLTTGSTDFENLGNVGVIQLLAQQMQVKFMKLKHYYIYVWFVLFHLLMEKSEISDMNKHKVYIWI